MKLKILSQSKITDNLPHLLGRDVFEDQDNQMESTIVWGVIKKCK